MSFRDATKSQDVGPDRLKPAAGTSILRASVEAKRVSDLCTGAVASDAARERILAWLADGAREVSWALCSFPRERWAEPPPTSEHLAGPCVTRHLALLESYLTRRRCVTAMAPTSSVAARARRRRGVGRGRGYQSAEAIVRGLGETRFELLQRLKRRR
jgi:hypothetical protein